MGRIILIAFLSLNVMLAFGQRKDTLKKELRSFGVGMMSYGRQQDVPSYSELSGLVKSGFVIPDTSQVSSDTSLGRVSLAMIDVHFDFTPVVFAFDTLDSAKAWKQRIRLVGGMGAGRGNHELFRSKMVADSSRGDTQVFYSNSFERFTLYTRAEYLWLNKRIFKGYVGFKLGVSRDISSMLRSYEVTPGVVQSPDRRSARQYNFGYKHTSLMIGFPIGFELLIRQVVGVYVDVYPEIWVSKVNGVSVSGSGTSVQMGLNFAIR